MRGRKAAEENIVPLQSHDDGHIHPPFDFRNAAGGEDVDEEDHVGLEFAGEPLGEALDFLSLKAFGASKDRQREVGDLHRIDFYAAPGGPVDEPRLVEPAIEPFGKPAEEPRLLLQIHVDAAVEDAM